MSGSVNRGKNDPTQSLQMIERPLLTPDELKALPKGQFVVMKTGTHPMRVTLKLFFKWGIQFDEKNPYTVQDNGNRVVAYADKQELIDAITERYTPKLTTRPGGSSDDPTGRQSQDYADRPVPKVDRVLREVKSALPYEDDAVINAFIQEEAMEEVKSRG